MRQAITYRSKPNTALIATHFLRFTLARRGITSERPWTACPAETIVDAGFDRIDRHRVAGDKSAAVTAEIEMVVLDLRTPVVSEGIFGPDADHPAAGGPPGRVAE